MNLRSAIYVKVKVMEACRVGHFQSVKVSLAMPTHDGGGGEPTDAFVFGLSLAFAGLSLFFRLCAPFHHSWWFPTLGLPITLLQQRYHLAPLVMNVVG